MLWCPLWACQSQSSPCEFGTWKTLCLLEINDSHGGVSGHARASATKDTNLGHGRVRCNRESRHDWHVRRALESRGGEPLQSERRPQNLNRYYIRNDQSQVIRFCDPIGHILCGPPLLYPCSHDGGVVASASLDQWACSKRAAIVISGLGMIVLASCATNAGPLHLSLHFHSHSLCFDLS